MDNQGILLATEGNVGPSYFNGAKAKGWGKTQWISCNGSFIEKNIEKTWAKKLNDKQ